MAEPLVSVLIPCYNAERWIAQTLQSVLTQTWRNLEIVVVNDGSRDKSLSELEAVTDPRLRIFSQENKGQTAALNHCLRRANGEFIQYLDADDLLHPEKIERQMARLLPASGCLAVSEWARIYESPEDARFVPDGTWADMASIDWLVEDWREGGGMMFPAQWLAPRPLVDRIGPWREDLTLNNDAEYFTRLALASEQVLFCSGAKAYYRSGISGSLSGQKSAGAWRSQWLVIDACERHLLAAEDSARTRRVIGLLWQRFAHAAYPYEAALANHALRRAKALSAERLELEGGAVFRLVSGLLGWKLARRLQRWSGRS